MVIMILRFPAVVFAAVDSLSKQLLPAAEISLLSSNRSLRFLISSLISVVSILIDKLNVKAEKLRRSAGASSL